MSKKENSSLFFIFLKTPSNELSCFLPLISTLPVHDLLPIIHKKLNMSKEVPLGLMSPQIGLLNETMTLSELGIKPYSEVFLVIDPQNAANMALSKSLEKKPSGENNGGQEESKDKDQSMLSNLFNLWLIL